jgi:hypothetical protein
MSCVAGWGEDVQRLLNAYARTRRRVNEPFASATTRRTNRRLAARLAVPSFAAPAAVRDGLVQTVHAVGLYVAHVGSVPQDVD